MYIYVTLVFTIDLNCKFTLFSHIITFPKTHQHVSLNEPKYTNTSPAWRQRETTHFRLLGGY